MPRFPAVTDEEVPTTPLDSGPGSRLDDLYIRDGRSA